MVYFLDVTPNYNVEDNNIWVFAVGFPACLVSACSRLSEALWLGCASSVMRDLPELVRGTQYFVCQAEESPENQTVKTLGVRGLHTGGLNSRCLPTFLHNPQISESPWRYFIWGLEAHGSGACLHTRGSAFALHCPVTAM